jgi:hypothetical protein
MLERGATSAAFLFANSASARMHSRSPNVFARAISQEFHPPQQLTKIKIRG